MDDAQGLPAAAFRKPEPPEGGGVGFILGNPGIFSRIPVAHLLHGGLFAAIGKDDAVAAERIVALPFSKISSVAQGMLTLGVFVPEGLVHIVPDEAPLVLGEFFFQADVAFHADGPAGRGVPFVAVDTPDDEPPARTFPAAARGCGSMQNPRPRLGSAAARSPRRPIPEGWHNKHGPNGHPTGSPGIRWGR